jgi:catechol 2,3-dioxygenase-like lactoylglutathione lyase family enzyme
VTNDQLEQGSDGESSHLIGHGRLSYVQIPAINVDESAKFYEEVFGWQVRGGTANHVSFVDTTGDMIGAWITGLATSQEPGVLPYIYVHGADAILERDYLYATMFPKGWCSHRALLRSSRTAPPMRALWSWDMP